MEKTIQHLDLMLVFLFFIFCRLSNANVISVFFNFLLR